MEHDPFALIEGMTIEAFATGASRGYLYLRGEYPLAGERMAHAIAAARRQGLLGPDIDGSGFAFDIEIRRGAGRVHLRRGDGALRIDRGRPWRAAQQAAVPGRGRACSASRPRSTTSRRS